MCVVGVTTMCPVAAHGCCAICIHKPSHIELTFHDVFTPLLDSDLPTVRQFLLRQKQLKWFTFGSLKGTKDAIDTVKVLKCFSGLAT